MLAPLYSICMLCYNNRATVEASLGSLEGFTKSSEAEIVVVDNESTDGSWEVLKEREGKGVKLARAKCSRGRGRQIAFEASLGQYILSTLDCDDEFYEDGIRGMLKVYHSRFEGSMLMTRKTRQNEHQAVAVSPRVLIEQAGGWRDLNWGEDWDLWNRVAKLGKYAYLPYPSELPLHKSVRVVSERETEFGTKTSVRFQKYRDSIRTGRPVFSTGEDKSVAQLLMYYLANASVLLARDSLDPVPIPRFDDTQTYLST